MRPVQEEFLEELNSNPKFNVKDYAALYGKYSQLAIQEEEKNGASEPQAKSMGNYYTVSTLSKFIANENKLDRIIAIHEAE
ncbi:MAG: hypothetical protein U9O86_07170 [Campylobacterota bacterium]|nr:hypothetical protein [Campylobacterota bacterium]